MSDVRLLDIILRWCDHPTVYVGRDAVVHVAEEHPGQGDWMVALNFPHGQQRAMVGFKVNPGGPSLKQIGAMTLRRTGGAVEMIPTPVEVIGMRRLGPGVWKPMQPIQIPGLVAGYLTFIDVPEPPPWQRAAKVKPRPLSLVEP